MSTNQPSSPDIDPTILEEAANWLVLFQSGEASMDDRANLISWCQLSPTHAAAWQRVQKLLDTFGQVPPKLGHDTLLRKRRTMRRQVLRVGLATMALPGGWLVWKQSPWGQNSGDLVTGIGEQRTLMLADGTRLILNTDSRVNIEFSNDQRRLILLSGEILVTTSTHDPFPAPRPFIVQTPNGSLLALGTRFNVQHLDKDTFLSVFEGAVKVQPFADSKSGIVHAGEEARFSTTAIQPVQTVDTGAALWERGLVLAREMRLDHLIAELARYHRGILRCSPAIASLKVSGAFPVTDTLGSLHMLEESLPVRISSITPYWISLQPR